MFITTELESMKGALEKISSIPVDQQDNQDKIWARDVRELSYDIEDSVDTIMVHGGGSEFTAPQGFKSFIHRCYNLLTQFQVHRSIATDIRNIKRRVIEVSERRDRHKINCTIVKPATFDPRIFIRYEKETDLVGINEARDEVMEILMEGNEVTKQQDKIVSIVGFGGLGKTTLANLVYERLRAQFDCSAFVSVGRTPEREKIFKDMFYQLAGGSTEAINLIDILKGLLKDKRLYSEEHTG